MPLPARFIDDLRQRLPLSGYIGQHVPLQRAGREWKACCPFHTEKSPSFYVNDAKGFYHCFGCGAHGDVIGFAMNHLRLSFPEAIETLAAEAGLPVPQRTQESREEVDRRARLYQCVESAAQFFTRSLNTPAGASALGYLQKRGLTDETIAAWRLGFAPDDSGAIIKHLTAAGFSLDEMLQVGLIRKSERNADHYSFFRGRVIFPVTDNRDRVVAFGARLLHGEGPKYINSSEHALFKKGDLLFGAAMARNVNPAQPLVLAEGYMDVIALWQAGFAAVAPLGTALTETQLQVLWRQAASRDETTPILSFDGDNAGMRAAARALTLALPHLTTNQTLNFIFLPQGEDPDSLIKNRGAEAFSQVLRQAMPLYDVLWQQTVAGRATTSPEARAALETALTAAIAPVNDVTLKRYYQNETKNRLWNLFRAPRTANREPQKKNNVRSTATGPRSAGLSPINPDFLRAQILLATLINHPDLLPDAEDWLLAHNLPSAEQENIRIGLLECLQNQGLALDAAGVKRYLTEQCGETAVSAILSESTYQHAAFARPGRPFEAARIGWLDVQRGYAVNRMRDDMRAAGRDLALQLDDASLGRMNALQAEWAGMPDTLALLDDSSAASNDGG